MPRAPVGACVGPSRLALWQRLASPAQYTARPETQGENSTRSTDDNEAVVRRFIEEIFMKGRPASVDAILRRM
jgi:hypothetical protein